MKNRAEAADTSHRNKFSGTEVSLRDLVSLKAASHRFQIQEKMRSAYIQSGVRQSRMRGRGMDFAEVRHYLPGDEIRHMDWRVTARTLVPHTKIYREERERPVYIIVDFNPAMYFGTRHAFKSVIAAEIAALWAWYFQKQGDRIGGSIVYGDEYQHYQARSGQHGLLLFLKGLADATHKIPPQNQSSLTEVLRVLHCKILTGAQLILISDFNELDAKTVDLIKNLRQSTDIFINTIYDPLEAAAPPPNRYTVTDGEKRFTFDSSDKQFCEFYQARFQAQQNRINELCRKQRIPILNLATDDDIKQKLKYFIRTFQK